MNSANSNRYSLAYDHRDKYLYVFVDGKETSKEIAISFYGEIFSKAEEFGYDRVLIEEDFLNQNNIAEIFEIADFIAHKTRGKIKLAHVDRQEKDLALNKFAENVAVNRGFRGRAFGVFEEAEQWLLED